MTTQPQQEYIITEEQLLDLLSYADVHDYLWTKQTEENIRSRPAPSAPDCPMWGTARVHYQDGDKNEWCCLLGHLKVYPPYRSSQFPKISKHDTTIRNQTLKEFESRLSGKKIVKDGEGERCNSYELIEDMLSESLRRSTEAQQ